MCRAQCVLVIALQLLVGVAHSWDFALSVGDRLEFYTDNGTKTDNVLLTSQNLTTLAYDGVHNMLLYVDKQNDDDAICGYNMTSVEYNCYTERNGRNIQGLAFDPVIETLFFTDTKERSINWFTFKPGYKNNVYGNLFIQMDDGIPTDIAVDSCRGYIYWINRNLTTSTIERARFDGSVREVVISSKYNRNLHSLAVDQQSRKIYWSMPETSFKSHICRADLNGKNAETLVLWTVSVSDNKRDIYPNSYTVSKKNLYVVSWTSILNKKAVWKFPKPSIGHNFNNMFEFYTTGAVGIAANYKLKDQFQGISDCRYNIHKYYETKQISREYYVGSYCVHGTKVNGQSLCKCRPGYTGERCEVSVCENYCFQGNCSFSEQGLPVCRCEAGYSGKRCEVNVCHGYCSNNGICYLNEDSQPFCQCQGDFAGHRCEMSDCLNYCLHGNCSLNEQGLPHCRCEADYSGERCEVDVCYGHCLNNGTCSLNEEDEPVCECVGEYEGERCEVPGGLNNGNSCPHDEDEPACQCVGSHEGSGRESDNNQTIFTSTLNYLDEREKNLTLADLLENWRKRNNFHSSVKN